MERNSLIGQRTYLRRNEQNS